ncbi:hypothetical protein U1Q18_022231 [Sarracenia purpurea var. burkii]
MSITRDKTWLDTFMAQWNTISHTFITTWNKMTPTLEDVVCLTWLPIFGASNPLDNELDESQQLSVDALREALPETKRLLSQY